MMQEFDEELAKMAPRQGAEQADGLFCTVWMNKKIWKTPENKKIHRFTAPRGEGTGCP